MQNNRKCQGVIAEGDRHWTTLVKRTQTADRIVKAEKRDDLPPIGFWAVNEKETVPGKSLESLYLVKFPTLFQNKNIRIIVEPRVKCDEYVHVTGDKGFGRYHETCARFRFEHPKVRPTIALYVLITVRSALLT